MSDSVDRDRRCILGVFAHPDDETTSCGGTLMRYARDGVEIYVVTATRGEQGSLGTGGLILTREELPSVREAEMRAVLQLLGTHPPIFLGYHDQGLSDADFGKLASAVLSVMQRVKPDVVITWGPSGISQHSDHIAVHRAAVEAFHRYRHSASARARLFYPAIPKEMAERFGMSLHESETTLTTTIEIREEKGIKLEALRMYKSQEDAQQLADAFESPDFDVEGFHQAHPPVDDDQVSDGFWP